ncbi:hypothetical protein BGAL_0553g00070 [Botrytis galanthina]|uniref:Uncharacterized protein n=1 Tax=Botrytis galanthina TaxID=278940 RepID=A0A4S8QJW2_9HELO|nr:hypothetical protein BGAL_0553g00070 [Botrytis galanthina]
MTKQHAMMCIYAPTSPMLAASRYCRGASRQQMVEAYVTYAQCSMLYPTSILNQCSMKEWVREKVTLEWQLGNNVDLAWLTWFWWTFLILVTSPIGQPLNFTTRDLACSKIKGKQGKAAS